MNLVALASNTYLLIYEYIKPNTVNIGILTMGIATCYTV